MYRARAEEHAVMRAGVHASARCVPSAIANPTLDCLRQPEVEQLDDALRRNFNDSGLAYHDE